jgi:hypothetical protein
MRKSINKPDSSIEMNKLAVINQFHSRQNSSVVTILFD